MATHTPWITMSVVTTLSIMVLPGIPACSPVAEGETATFPCNLIIAEDRCNDESGNILAWSVSTDQNPQVYCSKSECRSTSNLDEVYATIAGAGSNFTSILTLSSISRSSDVNIEGRWDCQSLCGDEVVTVCPKLEVFALPENPKCSASEVLDSNGEIQTVFVSCSSPKVYPQADCLFYQSIDEGQPFIISTTVSALSFPNIGSTVYYNAQCSLWIPVYYLGAGLHKFEGRMFPRVSGGDTLPGLVNIPASGTSVYLAFASADQGCSTTYSNGYFMGKSVTCVCHLTSEGRPKGTAHWYKNDLELYDTETLTFSHDTDEPEAEYACRAKSSLGVSQDTGFTPRFAFLDESSITVEASESIADLCDKTNENNQVTFTCSVPKENVNPKVYFSFSVDGFNFDQPQEAELSSDEGGLQRKIYFTPEEGKDYQVICRAQNSIFSDIMYEKVAELGSLMLLYETPSQSPEVTIMSKVYQDTDPDNHIVVNGSVTDVVCHIKGGNPQVHTTDLSCGLTRSIEAGNIAAMSVSSADDVTCVCIGYHASGCYKERTVVTLTSSSNLIIENTIGDDHGESIATPIIAIVIGLMFLLAVLLVIWILRNSRVACHRGQEHSNSSEADISANNEKTVYIIPTDADSGRWSLASSSLSTDTCKTTNDVDSVSETATSVYSDTVSTTSETDRP